MTALNIIGAKGEEFKSYMMVPGRQETRILLIFKRHNELSPTMAHLFFPIFGTPLTSIRRAITNLTTWGFLEKTGRYMPGKYGKPERIWKLTDKGRLK